MDSILVVILAAGKGKRIGLKNMNKVSLEVNGTPIILRTLTNLKKCGFNKILIVVGFAKESILKILPKGILTVEQKKRLGTAHALKTALKKIPKNVNNILVLNGDDSYVWTPEILKKLINLHQNNQNQMTFVTGILDNPVGIGRIIREKASGKVVDIVEEKDATADIRKLKEVNLACYLFKKDFLLKYLPKIAKSKVTGEYYLVSIVKLASQNLEKIESLKLEKFVWRGINTKKDLEEAKRLLL